MSPKEYVFSGVVSGVIGLFVAYSGYLWTTSDLNAKELNAKIDAKMNRTEVIEMFEEAEKKDALEREYLFRILDRIDKRTEKIEDKLMR